MRKVRARAPLRLGLAGGGSDVSPYCDEYGGSVMNATIDLHANCSIEQLDGRRIEFVSADQGKVAAYDVAAQLPRDGQLDLLKAVHDRVVRDFNRGEPLSVRITTQSDAPAGSGLGSSSTLVVCVLQALVEYMNLPLGDYDVAHLAYEIERRDMGLKGGKQDQYAATFGGFNFMEFGANDRVLVNPLRIKRWVVSELEASMVLFYTGVSRDSATIIDQQSNNVAQKRATSIDAMHRLKAESVSAKESLLRGDVEGFFESLRAGWISKKASAERVSNDLIERVETCAIEAGARAGKVSGAGGGGFMFFFADPEHRHRLAASLEALGVGRVVNAHFTFSGAESWRMS
ncbi:MAG: D-glycero-alpha-D-manno-heptose-7-phosphate kinase [Pseudomonadota bacterium]|jgi:D-glycero-alpha-D-manno-heptose-7-phosphate kinase